jgi:hypothetical protein
MPSLPSALAEFFRALTEFDIPPCRFRSENGESEIGAGLLLQMDPTEARPACAAVTAIGKEKRNHVEDIR